ncbi:MAG TPA: hypothetical protein VH593_30135, partial [Ktedonobacteraceae bacterium]
PHFFVFVMTLLTGILVATLALTPRFRMWFGPAIHVPFVKFKVPGSLVMLSGGLMILCITIMMDNLWHSAFGLDETQWSMPHDMLGWSWLTIILGFVSARLAFREYRPLNWITTLVLALLVLEFLCSPLLGPFYLNYSPVLLHALANLPIVRGEPTAQHMYRIYLHYELTRQTSPLFILMVTGFAGIALGFLQRLDKSARIFLLAPLLWSLALMGRDIYTIWFLHIEGARHIMDVLPVMLHEPSLWIPIPLVVAALVFMGLQRSSFRESRRYAIAGLVFGCCTFLIWHTSPWFLVPALLAIIIMPLGARIGAWICDLILQPTFAGLMRFVLICCAQIPAALGVVDLILRRTTP